MPIYFYLPPNLALAAPPDLSAWAWHRDIFPTLRALVFDETPRFGGGRNLFAKNTDTYAISFIQDTAAPGILISDAGAFVDFTSPHYMTWRQDGLLEEGSGVAATSELKRLHDVARANIALALLRIRACFDK